tara:strand:+ start:100 stop:543 length:444 start_codon:yes stop_codon:yes gene_type:complete
MAHTKGTLVDKITGVSKGWKRRDETSAEAAHEMAKKKGGEGPKQPTFFSDTGEAHGKGHRIHDTERNRKRYGFERDEKKKGGKVKKNTRRENRLEELGRVDAEKGRTKRGKRNLKSEKRRIVRELHSHGGSVGSRGVAKAGFGIEIK